MDLQVLYQIRFCNIEDNLIYNLKLVVIFAEDAISCTVVESVDMTATRKK